MSDHGRAHWYRWLGIPGDQADRLAASPGVSEYFEQAAGLTYPGQPPAAWVDAFVEASERAALGPEEGEDE
jgi:hypothetical protein